jgi:hypothetical protein
MDPAKRGNLPLAAPQQAVRQILETTGLIDVFSVYPSAEDAGNGANGPGRSRRQRRSGSVPPWLPDLAAGGRYAALPVIRWSRLLSRARNVPAVAHSA